MAERTPVLSGIDAALWRGGVGDGSEARRASSLYVAIFLLWPLAAIAAGLMSLLLAWFGRSVAQIGFLLTFGAGLGAPFVWQWWMRSLWRARRRAARVRGFVPVGDLGELATLAHGLAVRVRGRVRACSAFPGLAVSAQAPADAPADTVYEQTHARAGVLAPELWYELGCNFEIEDDRGQRALVRLAPAQVLPRHIRRVRVRGRDRVARMLARVLARMPVSPAMAARMGIPGVGIPGAAGTRPGRSLAACVHAIRAGDEVEILACTLPPEQRAVLHRASALRPVLGAHAGVVPLVIVHGAPR